MVVLLSYQAIAKTKRCPHGLIVPEHKQIPDKADLQDNLKPVNDAGGLFTTIPASKRLLLSKRRTLAIMLVLMAAGGTP